MQDTLVPKLSCACGRSLSLTYNELRELEDKIPTCREGRGCRSTSLKPFVETAVYKVVSSMQPGLEMTITEIVLATWIRDPMRFGLRDCPLDHPDSARVVCEIVRARRLGLIEKVRELVYKRL